MKTELPPITLLFAGEIFDGRDDAHPQVSLLDGTLVDVRVRIVPSRHLTEPETGWLTHYELGREAQRLQLSLQVRAGDGWTAADATFVDNLSPESHVRLLAEDERLNFTHAISQAERQIATGTAMIPLKQRLAATMTKPLEDAFQSLISSAATQLSKALGAKQP